MRRSSLAAILALALMFMAACGSSNGTTITVLGYAVVIKTAPPTTAQIGTSISVAFTVTENESDGSAKPASGKSFTVAVTAGGGTVNGAASATLTTAADGTVSLTWILGPTVGTQSVRGAVSSTQFLDVSVTATAAPATQLALTTTPATTAQSGVALTQQPTVQLQDAAGNPVAQALVPVTVAIDMGGGTLGGGTLTVNTNASGAAVFSGLAISGMVGNRTLKFTATLNGLPASVSSAPIALAAGPAAQLTITTQPSLTAAAGAVFGQQPALQLRDAVGNAVNQAGVLVTAAIATGGGTLGGTAITTTNASGLATFTNLSITGTVGDRTLTFTAMSLTGVTSSAVAITAASTLPSLAGSWSGTWVDTRYSVSGAITNVVLTQTATTFGGTGTIDLSSLGLGIQSGTATGTISGNTITFTFTAAVIGSGSGTLTGTNGSGTGGVTALSLGNFTFTGTASTTQIIGSFSFTSPTGGQGTITVTKQ